MGECGTEMPDAPPGMRGTGLLVHQLGSYETKIPILVSDLEGISLQTLLRCPHIYIYIYIYMLLLDFQPLGLQTFPNYEVVEFQPWQGF